MIHPSNETVLERPAQLEGEEPEVPGAGVRESETDPGETRTTAAAAAERVGGAAVLVRAGRAARFAADEFFSARISNPHTRRAYPQAVGQFLTWCEDEGLELRQFTPGQAGRFLEQLPGVRPPRTRSSPDCATSSTRSSPVMRPY